MEVERSNLLAFAKMSVRDVIQSMERKQDLILDEKQQLKNQVTFSVNRLLLLIEHCLCHGLRKDISSGMEMFGSPTDTNKTSILRRAKEQVLSTTSSLFTQICPDPWPVLVHLSRCISGSGDLSDTIQSMSEIRTGLGRSRVWIRQALMQKRLSTYFQHLVDPHCELPGSISPPIHSPPFVHIEQGEKRSCATNIRVSHTAFYHPGAMMLSDEGIVFAGLLVGLSSLDFCFVLKDNLSEMDGALQPIPYHVYVQCDVDRLERFINKDNLFPAVDLSSVIDQKNFLEELNRKLQNQVEQHIVEQRNQHDRLQELTSVMDMLRLENRGLKIAVSELKRQSFVDSAVGSPGVTPDSSVSSKDSDISPEITCIKNNAAATPSNETELNRLQRQLEEKTMLLDSLRTELSESQSRIASVCRQLTHSQTLLEQKQLLIRQLEGKTKGMSTIMDQMHERLAVMGTDKVATERTLNQMKLQLSDLRSRCSQQQADLESQQSISADLESRLNEQTAEVNRLQPKVVELGECLSTIGHLREELAYWKNLCHEQEGSLSEMAAIVTSSKLEADQLRESHTALKEAQWTDDACAPSCSKCQAPFNVSRRRHHCRNCGLIFCYACSAQTMSLPSAAKPVRVCDACHALLLHRYAEKS
ncbi:FYVE zinc finger, partial [Opisthorchis viverrini]